MEGERMKSMNSVFVVGVAVLFGGGVFGLYQGREQRVAGASIDVAELALRAPPSAEELGIEALQNAMAAPMARGNVDAAVRFEQLQSKKRELETRLAALKQELAQVDPNALRDAYELTW